MDRFSSAVFVPVQAAPGGRTVIDWRGIPLAVPHAFDRVPPRTRMPIARRWEESGSFFLKLVHPERGTTIDYAIRCLFNPVVNGQTEHRLYAFLEIAPHCPGGGESVPVWTVVERVEQNAIETLTDEAIAAQQPFIGEIIEHRYTAPRAAVEAAFGVMAPWQNPDWGDEGNLHLVCVKCLSVMADDAVFCVSCGTRRVTAP